MKEYFPDPEELPQVDEATVAAFKVIYSSPCDYATFKTRTSGQFEGAVVPLLDYCKDKNGEDALTEVVRERDKQHLLTVCAKAQSDLIMGVDPASVRQTIVESSSKITPASSIPDWNHHLLIAQEEMKTLAELGVELDSGLIELDATYLWRRKNVTIVAAPTSHGKTAFSLWMARRALKARKQLKVAYLAFEDYGTIPQKLASQAFGIPLEYFTRYYAQPQSIKKKVDEALMMSRQWSGSILICPPMPLAQWESELESFKPDVLIFDYLQRYVERYGAKESKRESIGKASDQFHQIAEKFNAFGIMCSQITRRENTRGGYGPPRRPQLYDLKESGDLENYADGVILLWHPAKESPEILDKQDYRIEVAKDKLGKCGEIKVLFHGETQSFTDRFGARA